MMAGSLAMARAMATRCFWPPESSLGWWVSRFPMPTISSSSFARAERLPAGTPAYIIGSSTFFWALVREMRLKF